MTVWFTSDTHFGHKGVIEYSNRPFEGVEDMDEALIERWNDRVKPGDRIYHLGDFSFHKAEPTLEILRKLNGQKYLIFGNHDKAMRKNAEFLGHWVWARDLEKIDVEGQDIVLCHYAMITWNRSHYGSWQLHGHSHGSLPDDPKSLRIDVGVDPHGQAPISFEEVREIMSRKTFEPVDHHGRRGHDQ